MRERKAARSKVTPAELAARYGVAVRKVLGWVRSGELRAFDAAARRGGRPRFLIDEADVAAFEAARAAGPAPRAQRRPRTPPGVTEYY